MDEENLIVANLDGVISSHESHLVAEFTNCTVAIAVTIFVDDLVGGIFVLIAIMFFARVPDFEKKQDVLAAGSDLNSLESTESFGLTLEVGQPLDARMGEIGPFSSEIVPASRFCGTGAQNRFKVFGDLDVSDVSG